MKLTNKEAYEIIRDNTSWAWVYPQDVKFKYGWIFHRTRDCLDGEYHKCKEPIDCYAIDSLYSYEHTGYQIEAWDGCEVEDSPFKSKNEDKVLKTIRELNRGYQKHKDDRFIEQVFEIAFGNDAIKKDYTRDDVLEKLMEFSNNALKLEELEDAR
tara:strand:- start:259 stop:723 length:465 start_codon:yes stop_codon:yes gene_type:complete